MRTIVVAWVTAIGKSTSFVFWPGTDWMDASAITDLRVTEFEGIAMLNATAQVALQVANDPLSPPTSATYVLLGSPITGDASSPPSTWASVVSSLGDKKHVRCGFVIQQTNGPSGDALGRFRALLSVQRRC